MCTDTPEPGNRFLSKGIYELNKRNYEAALNHFEESASNDNEYGLLFAGILYAVGFGGTYQYTSKACTFFKKATAKWDNSIAYYALGMIYLTDDGALKNHGLGLESLTIAAEKGWTEAKVQLAYGYHHGNYGIETDALKARYWYTKVLDRVSVSKRDSLFLFGNLDLKIDFGSDEDIINRAKSSRIMYRESPIFIRSGEYADLFFWDTMTNDFSLGTIQCQSGLAFLYFQGKPGLEQDYSKAIHYWNLGLPERNPLSSFHLGLIYRKGFKVKKNFYVAQNYFEQAYAWGHDQALFEIGYIYFKGGHGIDRDYGKSFATFSKYINKKYRVISFAFYYMARICETGSADVPSDYEAAMGFYRQAFKSGDSASAYEVGRMYREGLGVECNKDKEHEWYSKAVAMGNPIGHHALGLLYFKGYVRGKEGLLLALKHFKLALDKGHEPAAMMVSDVEDILASRL